MSDTPEIARAKLMLEEHATQLPNWARQLLGYIAKLELASSRVEQHPPGVLGGLLDDYGRAFHHAKEANGQRGTEGRANAARKALVGFIRGSASPERSRWVPCLVCQGTGRCGGKPCEPCKGTRYVEADPPDAEPVVSRPDRLKAAIDFLCEHEGEIHGRNHLTLLGLLNAATDEPPKMGKQRITADYLAGMDTGAEIAREYSTEAGNAILKEIEDQTAASSSEERSRDA